MGQTPLQVPSSPSEQGEMATAQAPPARLPATAAVMSKSRLENFRVASPVLPRALRADLYALYGFARLVDDIGDEAQGDRLAMLDWLDSEIDALYAGRPQHELVQRLLPTVRAHAIPPDPFRRLIEANRRDQEVTRYRTFDELLDYCRLSADPVGHLVLYVFDSATPERVALSDRVCSGLQIVEHLQDVAEDLARGPAARRGRPAGAPAPLACRARGGRLRGWRAGRNRRDRAARPRCARRCSTRLAGAAARGVRVHTARLGEDLSAGSSERIPPL